MIPNLTLILRFLPWTPLETLFPCFIAHLYIYFATGQSWLTSWGYTSDLPEDYDKLYALARRGADASEVIIIKFQTLQTAFNNLKILSAMLS